jgi:copper transport protein
VTAQARPAWWRRALCSVVAALVALALVLGASAPASAHAELVDTDPD